MKIIALSPLGESAQLALAEADAPQMGPRDVLIAVHGAGVNRADLLQAAGLYPPPPGAPDWLGLEVSGTVSAIGPEVDRWFVGQAVCALLSGGGYAEQVCVDQSLVLPVPVSVSLTDAAGLAEAACTVWSNFAIAGCEPGQSILIHGGAGGVGSFAVQYAAALGMTVFATANGAVKTARCRELGAVDAFDYTRDDWSAILAQRGGVDVVLDVVGAKYLERNLATLATGGRLVIIGLQGGRTAEVDLGKLLSSRASIIGTTLRSRPLAERAQIVSGVERDIWPLIPEVIRPQTYAAMPLAEAAAAHQLLRSGEVTGKLVLLTQAAT